MSTIAAGQPYVIAKRSGHGGFSQCAPRQGSTGVTRYGLCHRLEAGPPRHIATLGVLETGVTDAGASPSSRRREWDPRGSPSAWRTCRARACAAS
jgi:hypothetical protein